MLEDGQLITPGVANGPGVYRWVFGYDAQERHYIGEAANLARRFGEYRRGGGSSITNHNIHDRAVRVISSGGTVEVSLATTIRFVVDGSPPRDIDMTSKFERLLAE